MNTDQPTPLPGGLAEFAIQNAKFLNPATQPEPAKDEWIVGSEPVRDPKDGKWSVLISCTKNSSFVVSNYDLLALKAIAKRIVDDHTLGQLFLKWGVGKDLEKFHHLAESNTELRQERDRIKADLQIHLRTLAQVADERDQLRTELEQARALYQDRCQAVAKLREENEKLRQWIYQNGKHGDDCNIDSFGECNCGLYEIKGKINQGIT